MLPESGRQGDPPEWPLSKATFRELMVWEELWTRPQAIMWERQRQHHEVALYTRRFCEAEERGSSVSLSTLVRQMADSLGLTTPGLRANRWQIESGTEAAEVVPVPVRKGARDRFRAVS